MAAQQEIKKSPITQCKYCGVVLTTGILVEKEDFPGSSKYGYHGMHGVVEDEQFTLQSNKPCLASPSGKHSQILT